MGQVTLKGVRKEYGDVVAVRDMNLEVEDGEFVCFVGPSGCGKSTTLETIAGLTQPTAGTITIGDRDVTRLPPKDREISMVFQNIALFPHMDVYENMSFGLKLRNFSKDEIEDRVVEAAEILQISQLLDRMPDELSGGQRQRVAIGRAIVRDPEAFLMDEPLANLDAKLRVHMRTELQRLHKELGTTIIYVTHDQAEAMTMSDRIAVMNEGELQQIAPPLECYNRPANLFVAEFIGSPSMNTIEGSVTNNGLQFPEFDLALDIGRFEKLSVGDEVVMGVRPEDVYPASADQVPQEITQPITAHTDVLEPMGSEIFVYLYLGTPEEGAIRAQAQSDQILMSVDPDSKIAEDDSMRIVLDKEKINLFDKGSGTAIYHGLHPEEAVKVGEQR